MKTTEVCIANHLDLFFVSVIWTLLIKCIFHRKLWFWWSVKLM